MLALVAMVTKIWDSTSNNEVIVRSMAKGLDIHRVRQNIAYIVCMFIYLANYECTDGYVNCLGSFLRRRCVHQDHICDGYDDCGNGFDEDPEKCGQFAYCV